MASIDEVKSILTTVLNLGGRASGLTADSRLLGALPELDSMAVVSIITALEDHFAIAVSDDEISADTFATLGTLVAYVDSKVGA